MSRPKRRGIGPKMRRSVQGGGWVAVNCAASSHQPMGGSQSLSLAVGRTGQRSSLYFAFYMLLISSFGCFCPFCRYLKCKKKLQFAQIYLRTSWRHLLPFREWNSWSVNHLSRPILPASNSCYGGKKGSSDESVIMIIIPLLSLNIMQDSCGQALFRIVISSST